MWGLQFALCATPPTVYPRHRWTGADIAVDSIGLACAVHDIMPRAFERYCQKLSRKGEPGRHVAAAEGDSALPMADPPADGEGGAMGAEESALVEAALQGAGAGEASGGTALTNDHHRTKGLRWFQSKPFGRTVLLRMGIEVLRSCMDRQFHLDSDKFCISRRMSLRPCLGAHRGSGPRTLRSQSQQQGWWRPRLGGASWFSSQWAKCGRWCRLLTGQCGFALWHFASCLELGVRSRSLCRSLTGEHHISYASC